MYTDEQVKQVIVLYRQGEVIHRIAKHVELHATTVRNIVRLNKTLSDEIARQKVLERIVTTRRGTRIPCSETSFSDCQRMRTCGECLRFFLNRTSS